MKKWIALLTTITLLFSVGCVWAEETIVHNAFNDFDFSVVVSDGFSLLQEQMGNVYFVRFISQENETLNYTLSVSYSELYDGLSLADFTQEDKDLFISLLALNYSDPVISDEFTQDKTPLVSLNESVTQVDFVTIATVYEGYVFELHIAYDDYAQISQADYDKGLQILSDIQAL